MSASTKRSSAGTSSNKAPTYEVGEQVLCYHHPFIYAAKILKVTDGEEPRYYVHYRGWKSTWDEEVTEERLLKWTEDNIKKQTETNSSQSKRKNDQQAGKDEARSDDTSSEEKNSKRSRMSLTPAEPKKKATIELTLPENIITQLVNDWEWITKDQRLVELPRSPTVKEILHKFSQSENFNREDDGLQEVLEGLRLYFDTALGKMLLYRFERQQYSKIRADYGVGASMSDIYGCEHLLRLLSRLPQLISNNNVNMKSDAQSELTALLNDFIMFLSKNLHEFVLEVYDNAPPEYISISKSF